MAKNSISADIKAANAKLAKYLRRRKEEEEGLQIGKRKPHDADRESRAGQAGRGHHAKWMARPDFSYPTPMVDRPRTEDGATSFHFAYTTISKQGAPTIAGRPLFGLSGHEKSPGVDHAKYIERDGAAERIEAAHHTAYIERDGAIEAALLGAGMDAAAARDLAAVVNEAPLDSEATMLGTEDVAPGVPSIFSNISDDSFLREEFWRAVHRTEREAKVHQIIVDPAKNPGWWANLATPPQVPEPFRTHCLTERKRYERWASEEHTKPFASEPWKASADKCGKAIVAARGVAEFDFKNSPIAFKSGPGGRVQMRFIAELPHEISPSDRARIAQNFCDYLSSFAKDEHGEPIGMMYTAVIHAPDAHNDRRNYHLHIIAHDRPAVWIPGFGQWDFEIAEVYRPKGQRLERTRYPFRQNKIGEVTRKLSTRPDKNRVIKAHPHYQNAIAGADFVPHLRRKFAQITNTMLMERGIDRRYDPRSYAAMGIDRTPTDHLGTRAAALEAIGVPTIVGKLNAWAIWGDAERDIQRRARKIDSVLHIEQGKLDQAVREAHVLAPLDPRLQTLRELVAERSRLIAVIADDRRDLMTFDLFEAKAKSRAVRTRQTCLQFLAEIRAGKANAQTRSAERHITARWVGAQAWIDGINRDLAPERPRLAAAAKDIRGREERIQEIDALLAPIRARLHYQIDRARADLELRKAATKVRPAPALTLKEPVKPSPEPKSPAADVADLGPSLKPVTIDGIAIVAPTLDPNTGPVTPTAVALEASLEPVELTPLRPQPPSPSRVVDPTDHEKVDFGQASPAAPVSLDASPPAPTKPSPAADVDTRIKPNAPPVELAPSKATPAPAVLREPAPRVADAPKIRTPMVEPDTVPSPEARAPKAPTKSEAGSAPDTSQPVTARSPAEAPIPPSDVEHVRDQDILAGTSPDPSQHQRMRYEAWNAIINRITNERIAISVHAISDGSKRFNVPGLTKAERDALASKPYRARTTAHLDRIHDFQQLEIDRLVRWIEKAGHDPRALVLVNRTARIGAAPKAVRTLFAHWKEQERVKDALRAEHYRREADREARRETTAPDRRPNPDPDPAAAIARQQRIAEAARIYPVPEDARTRQVKKFIRLLRKGAPEVELRAAAEDIRADPIAREDVQRHRVELAIAWRTALDDDISAAWWAQNRGRGR